jgi:hypothetical protein
MSEFQEVKTKLKDKKALIAALIDMGWTENQIEICEKPKNLYGYRGDQRDEVAHIIIRKHNVGGSSNDIGFRREEDGTYTPIISKFDRGSSGNHAQHTGGYNDRWIKDLTQKYGVARAVSHAKAKGYVVKRKVVVDGKVRLSLEQA